MAADAEVIGVYMIRCAATAEVYIGRTKRLNRRWQEHRRDLIRGRHPNSYLQAAWNKYGSEAFSFQVLQTCPLEYLGRLEKDLIDTHRAADPLYGYNLELVIDGVFTHSVETRARMSRSHTGVKLSPERIVQMRATASARGRLCKGIPKSAAAKANISAALMGRTVPPETRAKISASKRGRPLSPGALEKARSTLALIRESRKGKPLSTETRAKIGEANKGRVPSLEERERRSKTLSGRPKTPEHIAAAVGGKRRARLARQQGTQDVHE